MSYTTILALLLVFLTTIYLYLQRKYSPCGRRKAIPGPKLEWFFGNLRTSGLLRGKATCEVLSELKEKYGDVCSFWLASTYCVVLSRAEHALHVLVDRKTYDQPTTTIEESSLLFPKALECLRGDDHKRHARFLLPMFRPSKILPYFDTIIECVDRLIDNNFCHRKSKIHSDLTEKCQDLLIDITVSINFDYDLENTSSNDVDIYDAFNDYLDLGAPSFWDSLLPYWVSKFMMLIDREYQRANRNVKEYIMKVIVEEQKRQQYDSTRSNRPKNLIGSLVAAVKKESLTSKEITLTPEELVDEVTMASLVGFEPTSAALCWFILYVSKNPEVQQKIKDELKIHNLTTEASLTHETLDSLVYVDCVVKELLRYSPTDPFIMRQATCDDMIDDIEIKKDDTILIVLPNLQCDPRYWKIDPTKFVPERWLGEDKSPPPGAYMPFGGGHRICIGSDLAILAMKISIVRLMQRLTFADPGDEADNSGGFLEGLNTTPAHLAVRVHVERDETD